MNEVNPQLIEHKFNDIKSSLDRIEAQTIKHNGRLTRLERTVLIVSAVSVTLLIVNGSKFVGFVMSII